MLGVALVVVVVGFGFVVVTGFVVVVFVCLFVVVTGFFVVVTGFVVVIVCRFVVVTVCFVVVAVFDFFVVVTVPDFVVVSCFSVRSAERVSVSGSVAVSFVTVTVNPAVVSAAVVVSSPAGVVYGISIFISVFA